MIALLIAARALALSFQPAMPLIQLGSSAAASTGAVSVSPYAETYEIVSPITGTATLYSSTGPIKEWSLSVVGLGAATMYWDVNLEVSNDGATWTSIGRHTSLGPARTSSGKMVFFPHRKARQARLTLTSVAGGRVCATAYGEP